MAAVKRMVVACALLVAACGSGGKTSAAARDAGPADAYQAALAPLARIEGEALDAVSAHMGDKFTSDEDLVAALEQKAIPRYREFVAGLEKLSEPVGPRGELHKRLIVLAHAELNALERLAAGVKAGDGNVVLEVNREQRRLAEEIDGLLASWAGAPTGQAASTPRSDANSLSK